MPKTEEVAFLSAVTGRQTSNIVPKQVEYPPLMAYMIQQQSAAAGKPMTQKPMLDITVNRSKYNNATQEGAKPS